MNAEMLLLLKIDEDGIGQAPIAYLNRVSVFNDVGHILPDTVSDLIGHVGFIFQQGSSWGRMKSTSSMRMKVSPWTRGMLTFTWAITKSAYSTAVLVISTLTPRLIYP